MPLALTSVFFHTPPLIMILILGPCCCYRCRRGLLMLTRCSPCAWYQAGMFYREWTSPRRCALTCKKIELRASETKAGQQHCPKVPHHLTCRLCSELAFAPCMHAIDSFMTRSHIETFICPCINASIFRCVLPPVQTRSCLECSTIRNCFVSCDEGRRCCRAAGGKSEGGAKEQRACRFGPESCLGRATCGGVERGGVFTMMHESLYFLQISDGSY